MVAKLTTLSSSLLYVELLTFASCLLLLLSVHNEKRGLNIKSTLPSLKGWKNTIKCSYRKMYSISWKTPKTMKTALFLYENYRKMRRINNFNQNHGEGFSGKFKKKIHSPKRY